MKIIYKTILSLIIWNGKMSQFAEYLRSLTTNIKNKTKQFFASPEKLKRIDFRNFSVRTTTLLCHTAPHHETRGQREVHITVSHSTTSYNRRTDKKCTLQCLTELGRTTTRDMDCSRIFNMSTDVNACDCTLGVYGLQDLEREHRCQCMRLHTGGVRTTGSLM